MRYKLVKAYPGSPEVGTVVTGYAEGYRQLVGDSGAAIAYFTDDEVEGWDEYWKPVSVLVRFRVDPYTFTQFSKEELEAVLKLGFTIL